mgnify:FL=1
MDKIIFKKKPDGTGPMWFAGIYKIVRYEKDSQNNGRPTYRAYLIRKGERMWGYYVDAKTPFYRRVSEAHAACRRHAKTLSVRQEG